MFMDAWCCVGACAGANGDFPLLEVREEGVPLIIGGSAVFLPGTARAAPCDEGPVGFDRLGGVDRLVAERGLDARVPADDLRDVWRQAAHDRVGDEDPSEVVRGEDQWCVGGVGERGGG